MRVTSTGFKAHVFEARLHGQTIRARQGGRRAHDSPAALPGIEQPSAGMLLSQPALGRLIGVDGQTVARWEKSGRVPRMADKTVRLHYLAHARGDEPIRSAVERLVGRRIVVC